MKEQLDPSEAERRYDALPQLVKSYLNVVYTNRNPKLTPEEHRLKQHEADHLMMDIQAEPKTLTAYLNWQVFAIDHGVYPKGFNEGAH